MNINEKNNISRFQDAISTVEALSTEEQTLLIEIIQKRLQEQKRKQLKQEIEKVRKECQSGQVVFGSAEDFMNELEGE